MSPDIDSTPHGAVHLNVPLPGLYLLLLAAHLIYQVRAERLTSRKPERARLGHALLPWTRVGCRCRWRARATVRPRRHCSAGTLWREQRQRVPRDDRVHSGTATMTHDASWGSACLSTSGHRSTQNWVARAKIGKKFVSDFFLANCREALRPFGRTINPRP